ncbi:hypothetical protein V9T40_010487 [Parthenolecanium corni]|uniref:Uncharacterized protein n=1 Tax=Parthenolecanium corni TaxID=536013 RepID=A0AAN9TB67_9HEMI
MKSNTIQKWRESKNLTILAVAVALCLDNMILTVVASISAETKHQNLMDETSQLGFMLASKSVVQLLFNPVIGPLTHKYEKQNYRRTIVYNYFPCLRLSLCRTLTSLIFPLTLLGLCCGLVEIALLPELGHLVDIRHSASYANVYAIGDFALCLGFSIAKIRGLNRDSSDESNDDEEENPITKEALVSCSV